MKILCLVLSIIFAVEIQAQQMGTIPYYQIPDYPSSYTSGNVISRLIDGLGYRYYWASEGLTEKDLLFRPSLEGKNTLETIAHINELSLTILNVAMHVPNERPYKANEKSYEKHRSETLINFKKASELFLLKTEKELDECLIIFKRGEKTSEFPFWNLINGQIADAIYHTGQLVSFRRSSGNPINSQVNVFTGKTAE